jgi:tight adherence protein B
MDFNTIMIGILATVAIGAAFQGFVYPYLSGDIRAEKRQAALASSSRAGAAVKRPGDRSQDADKRRKQVADSLKEIEQKGKSKKVSLEAKIKQAGLTLTKQQFFLVSAGLAVGVGAVVFYISENVLYILPGMLIGGFGVSNWILGFLRKRRIKKFVAGFPDAVDIIIRGVKAGLPLGDCLRVIAGESAEPVRSEFRQVIESTTMGLPLGEAVERLYERVPVTEANFFSIVLNIQQKSGGNLSEALGNLARVLRERKKMQQKVQAMSSEAKASAGIIGSLPFCVTGLLYLSSPRYIELLWQTSGGRTVMAICGFWMFVGIMSMKKMINFDM